MHSTHFLYNCIANFLNINSYTAAPSDHTEQLTTFHHGDAAWKTDVKSEFDITRGSAFNSLANLGDYLARPVLIRQENWTSGVELRVQFDPWTAFLEDPNVRNRIEGYKLLQGKLHIRVAVTGNPFIYGLAYVAYRPRASEDLLLSDTPALVNFSRLRLPKVFVNPNTSEGGEMVLPFFNPDNWIDLTGETYKDMGQLYLDSINNLIHANSATASVDVTIYAWMSDVRLSGPTSEGYGAYTQQSGDEYGTGIISKPASAVARVAGMLTQIPALAPFARATEYAANVTASVAHVFGFSRPIIISDIQLYKPRGCGNLAATDAHDASLKLALDSKQELAIDPRTVGLSDVDELAMSYIAQKEAYINTFTFSESTVVDSLLTRIAVSPVQHAFDGTFTPTAFLNSPITTISLPFEFWRGTLIFRFQFVASQMHRGRFRLVYDPGFAPTLPPEYNQTYNRVIDLAGNRDIEIAVGWHSSRSWLSVNDEKFGSVQTNDDISVEAEFSRECHNGTLAMYVVNALTSPDPALENPIYCNVYIRAGEDFELASPQSRCLDEMEYYPQSGEEDLVDADKVNMPEGGTPVQDILATPSYDDPTNHVYMGEDFRSIRALLKRFCFHTSYTHNIPKFRLFETNFPVLRHQNPNARNTTDTGDRYNYVDNTYLNYFTPCYAGWRGGIRNKYVTTSGVPATIIVTRAGPFDGVLGSLGQVLPYGNYSNQDSQNWNDSLAHRHTRSGSAICTGIDGSCEVEIPYYSWKRFSPTRTFFQANTSYPVEKRNNLYHYLTCKQNSGSSDSGIYRFVAAADDFSLFFWQGQPLMTRRAPPTPPS